ncbi:c-type cytochrome [Pseudoxanthomonas putridarboris]|uniref:C-type cytochrome n=1 Tax=Pseudoxanthomonas putridarboris TaxID=752605 RepID=A0ABU9IZU5_9GAMM
MVGLRRQAAGLLLGLACATVAAQADAPGRQLYQHGRGQDPVAVSLGDPPVRVPEERYACARCHGASGMGGSEGGIAAPALAANGPSGEARLAWLEAALREGRGRDGRRLLPAMPRYALSRRDLVALADYLSRLPYAAQPGLDPHRLRIALDMSGTPFPPAGQAWLRADLRATVERLNREGGLFGRTLELVDDDRDAYFGLGWVADPGRGLPHLAVRAPPDPAAPPCNGCCATLHPGLAAQLDWLRTHLRDQGLTPALQGSLAGALGAADASTDQPTATVYVGDPAGLPSPRIDAPVYAFADLGLPAVPRDDVLLVSPVELHEQMAEVERLQQAEQALRASPRLATAAVELRKALALFVEALASSGRQASAAEVCARLLAQAPARQRVSLLRLSDGTVVASGEP